MAKIPGVETEETKTSAKTKAENKAEDKASPSAFEEKFTAALEAFNKRMDALEARLDSFNAPSESLPEGETSTDAEEDVILKKVHRILGKGFTYRTFITNPGVTFRLEVIAPKTLRESEEAFHSKVIPYLEADTMVDVWLEQVRSFLLTLCDRRGIAYEAHKDLV